MANDEHNFGRLNAQDKTLTVFGFAFLGNGPRHNFVVPFFRARLPQLKKQKKCLQQPELFEIDFKGISLVACQAAPDKKSMQMAVDQLDLKRRFSQMARNKKMETT